MTGVQTCALPIWAIQALDQKDFATATRSLLRVPEVIAEATLRLNVEAGVELAQNLQRLYSYWTRETLEASKTRDTQRLAAVAQAMGEICQAWEQFHLKKTASERVTTFQLGNQLI